MFFKRLKTWLLGEEILLPKEWPVDSWDRMFTMAHYAQEFKLGELGVHHLDHTVEVVSSNVDELFAQLEILINCVAHEEDVPDGWNDRNRTKWIDPIPDYYYHVKHGYRQPQEVLEIVVEKALVIYNLIESQEITVIHPYYSYMRREFNGVVCDVLEVLNVSLALSKLPK
jgi:hypothetical protein